MKFSKKDCELIQQNKQNDAISQKHEVNLQKNSNIYFQVGLIVCLLITFTLFETSFKTTNVIIPDVKELPEDDMYVYNLPVKIYEEPKQLEKNKKNSVIFKNPIIKDDYSTIEHKDVVMQPITNEHPLDPGKITVIEKPEDLPPVNVMAVEQVPIFPGCEDAKTNDERRKCMSEKIASHVQKKFNTSIAGDLGLKGKQKIFVMFKIDKQGHVIDIKTSAKQNQLDREAARVVGKLPQMIPGKQKDKNVEVLYSLPIIFNIIN